jgi:hypothetical protein
MLKAPWLYSLYFAVFQICFARQILSWHHGLTTRNRQQRQAVNRYPSFPNDHKPLSQTFPCRVLIH